MSLKKVSVAIVALLALGAVLASSASAAVVTEAQQFHVEGAELGAGVKVNADGNAVGTGTLETEIGTTKVELQSTEISCEGCTIENKEVTSKAGRVAFGTGKVRFENVTVVKPVNCIVKDENGVEGQVVTKALNIHGDFMDVNGANQKAFVQFVPVAGAGTTFAQFDLQGAGCAAISGKKNVTGSVFGESANNTGVEAVEQNLNFSPAIQTTAEAKLFVGAKEAKFTGTGAFFLTGEAAGENFSIK